MTLSWRHDDYEITTDPARVDREAVHAFLAQSYWARDIPREVVDRSIDHSLPFSVWSPQAQVGFARVVSDRSTFAYVGDVFVLPEHRGRGLSVWLMQTIVAHPDLQGLRRWSLLTRDAHGLYEKVGFRPLAHPSRWMERHDPEAYARLR